MSFTFLKWIIDHWSCNLHDFVKKIQVYLNSFSELNRNSLKVYLLKETFSFEVKIAARSLDI